MQTLPEANDSPDANAKIKQPRTPPVRTVWGISYIKRKMHERKSKYKDETPTDRAARRTAVATIWMASFTLILALVGGATVWILKNQLREMHEGGVDTSALAKAAGKQADAAKAQSDQAKAQTDKMAESLAKTDALIGATKTISSNTKEALNVSQRAYVTVGRKDGTVTEFAIPGDHSVNTGILIYFQNSGHLPAKFNWGLTGFGTVIVPPIPGFPPVDSPHRFAPMTRTINHKDGSRGESGGVIVGGDSVYSTDLGSLPTDSALQLIRMNRLFMINGAFEYCDALGSYSCRDRKSTRLNSSH